VWEMLCSCLIAIGLALFCWMLDLCSFNIDIIFE
jgi:hypothetical protein